MQFLPLVIRAEHRGGFRVHLVFNDGATGTVDCAHWLRGPVFEPLKKPAYFRRFFVDAGALAWPNGADIAPETLYEAVQSDTFGAGRSVAVRERRAPYGRSKAKAKRR